jgi:protein SCO1
MIGLSNSLHWLILGAAAGTFLVAEVLLLWSLWKGRRESVDSDVGGGERRVPFRVTAVEVIWTALPALLLGLGMAILLGPGGMAAKLAPAPSLDMFGDVPVFALHDQLERPVTSDDLRGKVVVANFIYTSCQDTCPLLTHQMQLLQDRLRAERWLGSRVQLLSFSVDPARDTPMVLRAYAEKYHADADAWRFLTGPEHYVRPVIVQGFKLGVQPVHADVMHSNRIVLIDREGRIRTYYDGLSLDPERVLREIRVLLR